MTTARELYHRATEVLDEMQQLRTDIESYNDNAKGKGGVHIDPEKYASWAEISALRELVQAIKEHIE
jgi:hypothetical protein